MKAKIQDRLQAIDNNVQAQEIFNHMVTLSREIHKGLEIFDIINKVELRPNDLRGGSISFYISTFPDAIFIKLWNESGYYFLSLFRKIEGMFDQQLTGTFNEDGILTCKDLDEFEERILDFLANEIYNRKHTEILEYTSDS
jgi:hypothetical protein